METKDVKHTLQPSSTFLEKKEGGGERSGDTNSLSIGGPREAGAATRRSSFEK